MASKVIYDCSSGETKTIPLSTEEEVEFKDRAKAVESREKAEKQRNDKLQELRTKQTLTLADKDEAINLLLGRNVNA